MTTKLELARNAEHACLPEAMTTLYADVSESQLSQWRNEGLLNPPTDKRECAMMLLEVLRWTQENAPDWWLWATDYDHQYDNIDGELPRQESVLKWWDNYQPPCG